jgi:uncharacterized protein YkwD
VCFMKKLMLIPVLLSAIILTSCEQIAPANTYEPALPNVHTAAESVQTTTVYENVPPTPETSVTATMQTVQATETTVGTPSSETGETTAPVSETTVATTVATTPSASTTATTARTTATTTRTTATTARTTAATTTRTTATTARTTPALPEGTFRDNIAREILALVNEERTAHGLAPVAWSDEFAGSARTRAREITVRFEADHRRPDGRTWDTSLREAGIRFRTAGENMARGGHSRDGANWYTPEVVMKSWMNSEGHRENILNANFELLGVGAFDYNGTRYYVQHFGTI